MVPQVTKLLRKERVLDAALCRVAADVVVGVFGAGESDLGGGLFKKRLARPGHGKRGGFRVIIGYRPPSADRLLVLYAFPKNAAATVTPQGQQALARAAAAFIAADDRHIDMLIERNDIRELDCGDDRTP